MSNKKPDIWGLFEAVKAQSPSLKTVNGKWKDFGRRHIERDELGRTKCFDEWLTDEEIDAMYAPEKRLPPLPKKTFIFRLFDNLLCRYYSFIYRHRW